MSLFWCLTEAWDPRLPVWKDQLWVDEGAVHHSQRHHLRPQRHRGAPAGKKCPNSLTCFHWLIFSTKNSSNPDFTSEWSLTEVCSIGDDDRTHGSLLCSHRESDILIQWRARRWPKISSSQTWPWRKSSMLLFWRTDGWRTTDPVCSIQLYFKHPSHSSRHSGSFYHER